MRKDFLELRALQSVDSSKIRRLNPAIRNGVLHVGEPLTLGLDEVAFLPSLDPIRTASTTTSELAGIEAKNTMVGTLRSRRPQ